jgi:hypothetical protein
MGRHLETGLNRSIVSSASAFARQKLQHALLHVTSRIAGLHALREHDVYFPRPSSTGMC